MRAASRRHQAAQFFAGEARGFQPPAGWREGDDTGMRRPQKKKARQ
jgi:hypothetical protein